MKYSIIIPIYKTEKYLKKCLSSILNQKYDDYEIILVNDGSPDESLKICQEYASKYSRIKLIDKDNEGVVIARQTGVENAKGDYLLFIDSDDWISSDLLESIDSIVSAHSPDLLCFESYDVDFARKKKTLRNDYNGIPNYLSKEEIEEMIFPRLIQGKDASHFPQMLWSKVFKRKLFYQTQIKNVRVNMGEDFACVAPYVYKCESIRILRKPLYFYRHNTSSLTSGKTVFDWMAPELCARHVERFIDMSAFDFQEQMFRRICHEIFNVSVSQFNQNTPYSQVISEINRNLNNPYYKTAIDSCTFTGRKALMMRAALKYRLYKLLWLYSKLKRG